MLGLLLAEAVLFSLRLLGAARAESTGGVRGCPVALLMKSGGGERGGVWVDSAMTASWMRWGCGMLRNLVSPLPIILMLL